MAAPAAILELETLETKRLHAPRLGCMQCDLLSATRNAGGGHQGSQGVDAGESRANPVFGGLPRAG